MQNVRVPLDDTTWISLDLRRIDHQPVFLDGMVTAETEERELLECLVPAGGTAIDVGANMGVYTLMLARLVGPNGRVVAYEPDANELLVNAATWPQVIVRKFAVSNEEAQVLFRRERSTALSRIVSLEELSAKDSPVVSVTLDNEVSRLRLDRVDFLKIDVEGAEERALNGARSLLSSSCPPVIFFEWIPAFRDRWKQSAFVTLNDIVGSNWRLFRIGWGQPVKEIFGFREPDKEANILAFPPCHSSALMTFLKLAGVSPALDSRGS
jgi:FkbM family methyltransferase